VTLHLLVAEFADLGLTGSEINALGNLGDSAKTVSELGAAIGSKPATLTGILDRLEARGLVARRARPGDRRAVLVGLTVDGERVAIRIRERMAMLESRALAGLSAEAIGHARLVLAALSEAG
jgi:DNA-binding MarR family transcriptional regulator